MKYYDRFYDDLAKQFGASSNPVVSADSWGNIIHLSTAAGTVVGDMRVFGGNLVPFVVTPPQCVFYGNWSVFVLGAPFATAGSVSLNLQINQVGTPNYFGIAILSKFFAAAATQVPFSDYYQFTDTAFSNVCIGGCSGAGNEFDVYVKFDGVRLTWG